uniref:Heavy metal-associated isoprenylated plant protein 3-like n=1 Tax=Nelumbo nucifera TaxID=4432 RepID=A0A822ZP71_NELNU|nr:TPA_asm: hypothetical protein HUJ06_003379 [Nelumbo nucifera]
MGRYATITSTLFFLNEKKEEAKPDKPSGEKEEKKTEESKDSKGSEEAKEKEPPPTPEEVVLRVYMHCEGCAKKVKRSLRGFEERRRGVEK